jgi:prolyl-tRNA synthetase
LKHGDWSSLLFQKYSKLLLFQAIEILELYRRIYEEYLAVPVIEGTKSEVHKFSGAIYTNTVEVRVNIDIFNTTNLNCVYKKIHV